MTFQNIEFLYGLGLLLPLAVLFFLVLKWKKNVRKQMGDEELVNHLIAGYSAANYNWKFILILLSIAFCIVGAANLRSPKNSTSGNKSGIDFMVALDVSNSMLAQDIKPNRLERARQVINKLMDKMDNNRMGLVLFAGQAFLQMPLTGDLTAARLYVANANPDVIPNQGTVVGDALKLCNTSLDTKEKKYKAVILISDGEDHDENTGKIVETLKENGVIVFTVGIGSPDGSPIYDQALNDFKKDEKGETVVTKLNEKDLKDIAEKTGGQYQLFTNADDVANKLYNSLESMEKKRLGGSGVKVYHSYFQWFLILAFVLLLVEIIIPERKMKWFAWSK